MYREAVEDKAQNWKLLQNLQGERILNGIEVIKSLSESLNQSLWSVNSLNGIAKGNNKSITSLEDDRLKTRLSSSSTNCLSNTIHLQRAKSADQKVGGIFSRHHQVMMPHLFDTNLNRSRTNSTTQLEEGREAKLSTKPLSNLLHLHTRHSVISFNDSLQEINEKCDKQLLTRLHSTPNMTPPVKDHSPVTSSDSLQEFDLSPLQQIRTLPVSDDSGTESGSTSVDELITNPTSTTSPSLDCAKAAKASEEIADADYTVKTPSPVQDHQPTDCITSSLVVTLPVSSSPSPPLKSILRPTKSLSAVESRNGLSLQVNLIRASSDDSGIAMKPMVSMGTELEQNALVELNKHSHPSSLEQIDSEECLPQPKKQVRLHLQEMRGVLATPANEMPWTTTEDKLTESVTTVRQETTLTTSMDESIDENAIIGIRQTPAFSNIVASSGHRDNRQQSPYIDRDEPEMVSTTQLDNKSAAGSVSVSPVDHGREKTVQVEEESNSQCLEERMEQSEEVCSMTTRNKPDRACVPPTGKEEVETQQELSDVLAVDVENDHHTIGASALVATKPASKSLKQDKKVQTLIEAFNSFSEGCSDENPPILTSPKKSSCTPLEQSRLPVPKKRANSDTPKFSRQYAKRYRDNSTLNKTNSSSVENKAVTKSRTAKNQTSTTSLKSVSHKPVTKIPVSSTNNLKATRSLKVIPTGSQSRRSSRTTLRTSCVGNGPIKMFSPSSKTPPRSLKHSPAVRRKTKDYSIDEEALTQLHAMTSKQSTPMKGKERIACSSCMETKPLRGACAKRRPTLDRLSSEPTLRFTASLHSSS